MEERPELTLIGTGHVLDIGDTVRDAIVALRPDWVFVELDRGRLKALIDRRMGRPPPTGGNWFHRRLQRFQERVAASYGTQAGDEMLAAVDGARLTGAKLGLVDRPIDITLKRAIKELTWREKFRAAGLALGGGIKSLLPGAASERDAVDAELEKYAENPEATLDELARTFPTIRRVVIDERDAWMSERIARILAEGGRGVAVVGDGHVAGMLEHLADLEPTAFRLDAVRAGDLPKPVPDGNSASFSFEV